MIRLDEERPGGAIVARCTDTVTIEELTVLLADLDDELRSAPTPPSVVIVLDDGFDGFGPGAWADAVEDTLRMRFHRAALVSDDVQLMTAANLMKWMLHGDLRTFHNDELDRAINWAGERR